MKKFWLVFFIFILIFFIYFLFAPVKVYKKKTYYFHTLFNITEEPKKRFNCDGYFYLDKECGYFSLDNGMLHYKKCSANEYVLANKYFYVLYEKVGDSIKVFSPYGELFTDINAVGYPYLLKNFPLIFVLKTNSMGFTLYSMNGEKIIDEIDFTSMITSIDMDKNSNILISTLDGYTYLFSINSTKIFQTKFRDSKISITKSSTIDNDGNNIAICSGLYPEYIEFFKVETGARFDQIKTDTNFRYSSFIYFLENKLYYEGNSEIKCYNYLNKKENIFRITGIINEINFNSRGNILISTKKDEFYYLTIFSQRGNRIFYKEFKNPISNFEFIDSDSFYFKLADSIIQVKFGFDV